MSIALYTRYRRTLKSLPPSGRAMPYDWTDLPNPLDGRWMAYSQMLNEFSREIANTINAFSKNVESLNAWAVVSEPLSDKQKFEIAHEFVDTLGTITLIAPHMLKSRFLFATAHLCHQANQANASSWQDDLPLDNEIYMDATERYGKKWSRFSKLKRHLDKIGGKAFREATHDFRNSYNHRFSPRFMFGITNFVTRGLDKDSGQVWYGFGGTPPLDLREITDLLIEQRDQCYLAFDAFQALVREHEAVIRANG